MSRIPVRFVVLASILVLVDVGGLLWIRAEVIANQRQVRIVAALPARDVDAADRLALVFDQPIVDASVVGQVLPRAPFVLAPALAGQWSWAAPERLEFRLAAPLPPGRVFTARAEPDAEGQLGRRIAGATEFRFQTRALALETCELAGVDRGHATFELRFNQPVNPADLLRMMQVRTVDGRQALETTVLTVEPGERLMVRTTRPPQDELQIVLDGRLTGCQAELALGEGVVRRLKVIPAFALLRATVEPPALKPDVEVTLHFTRDLDFKQNLPGVDVKPAVEGLRVRMEDGDLVLKGQFACNQRYVATVDDPLLAGTGEALAEPQTVSFDIPDREPRVSFPLWEGILSPAGNLGLEVEAVNVAGLSLSLARLHANNLVAALHGEHPVEETHRQLPAKTLPLKLARNAPTKMLLELGKLLDSPQGVYHIEAAATDREWTNDNAIITLTDLGLTVKQERGGVLVWVTSLRTAEPVAGATVTGISENNQVLARGVTDADGLARLAVSDTHPDGPIWVVTAERDGDLSYLRPDERPWILDDVDQSGRSAPTTYDVLVYAERGVYRPGDTVHLTGIVRDAAGRVPPAFPLAVRVTRPDGRKVAEVPATFDAGGQGILHCDYATPADGQLGRYGFAVALPGAAEDLGQTRVLVEEFVPVRIEVTAEATQARFGPEETPAVNVHARYLFDQPAAGLPLAVTGEYRRVPYVSTRFPQFTFGTAERKGSWKLPDGAAESLDDDGQAEVELPIPESTSNGLWEGRLSATVTEPGGRSVSANFSTLVDTAGRHIGLRLPAGRVLPLDGPLQVEWVLVTGDDAATNGALEFAVSRVEYDSVIEMVNGRPVWKSVEQLVPVWSRKTGTEAEAGAGTLEFNVRDAGRYRLRATEAETKNATTLEFFAVSNPAELQSVALDRPERLEIVLDRDAYVPGATAKVLVRSPFPGRLLLTLEAERVVDQRVIVLAGSTAEIELPVPATLRGGAFVSATLIRGFDPAQDKWLPYRALGLVRLLTDPQNQVLPVKISAPATARPGSSVAVRVETSAPPAAEPAAAPAVVHLWAVDEGILRTTAYVTPNPLEHFFGKRQLEVSSADIFADLLPDYRRPADIARIGGDGGDNEEALRRNPVRMERRAPAVVWRTAAAVGADGSLTATLDLPKMTGELRLMAVAVAGDRYGRTEQPLTVTTPLLVEAAWPRFAAPDDRFEVPVKIFNTSPEPLSVTLALQVNGLLKIELPDALGQVAVPPGEPQTVWLRAVATGMGPVAATVTASAKTGAGESLVETAEGAFPVRPIAPLHSETRFVRVAAGAESPIELPGLYLPGTGRATVTISGQPQVELLPALDQLLEYPYGCVEQTTSRLYALLFAPELLDAHREGAGRVRQVRDMIGAGLLRLWSMQTRDGGVSYWPGDPHSSLWPSAYVGHFLLAARHAGYTAEPRFVGELLKYLKAHLNADAGWADLTPGLDDNTRALLCHVLAGFGQPQEGWQARLAERLDRLDMGGRAHLAAAWQETGKRERALAALPPDTIELTVASSTGARITSQVQQEATLLAVLLDLEPQHAWVPVLVRKLETARTGGYWGNTLENATALAALARYQLLAVEPAVFSGELRIGEAQRFAFDQQKPMTARFELGTDPARLTSSGTGNIYVTVQTHGLSAGDHLDPFDRQLQVRRTWTDRSGKAIDPTALKVGDLVYVQVTLAAPGLGGTGVVQNVALVDALPGGLEVEHPGLATSAGGAAEAGDDDAPDRVEFRDDRVVIFTPVAVQPRSFRYALRAVSAGHFAIPPVEASCMYDPALASRHGGGVLEVAR